MTTVVYRDGVLAADTLVTADGIKVGHKSKLVRLKRSHLIGFAGDIKYYTKFLEREPEDNLTGEFSVIEVIDGRVLTYSGDNLPEQIEAPFYAIGSGWEIAMGALAMGATAEEAIKITMEYDINTGGEVECIALTTVKE